MPFRRSELLRSALAIGLTLACLTAPADALANNDSWSTPDALFFAAAGGANTTAYGVEPGEPVAAQDPCPALGKTAWWRINGTGQPITLTTAVPGTTFNTVLVVLTGGPQAATRIACNDNAPGDPLNRSTVTFNSARGTSYLIQVGGRDACAPPLTPCPEFGPVVLRASAPRPPNDDRAAAASLVTGVARKTTNVGASQERGELTACGTSRFAATVWYRWTTLETGRATFSSEAAFGNVSTNRSDTVLGVYRVDSGVRVGCNDDDAGQLGGRSRLVLPVTRGDYLLQVGAAGTEGATPIGEGSIVARVDFAKSPPPKETVRPLKRMAVTVSYGFSPLRPRDTTTFTRFRAQNAPKRSRVVARCLNRRGKRCAGKLGRPKRFRNRHRSFAVKTFLHTYRAGTRLELQVSKKGYETMVKIVKVRKNKQPDVITRCIRAPATRRVRC